MKASHVAQISRLAAIPCLCYCVALEGLGAGFSLIGTHPTAPQTAFPTIHTLKAYEDRIYLGYGDWDGFPAVVIGSYVPREKAFHIEFASPSDDIGIFREIGGVLYLPSTDPVLFAEFKELSYRANGVWRDTSPAGMIHVFDIATLTGSDLWLAGSKNVNEYGPTRLAAVFQSEDGGRTWKDRTVQSTLDRYYWAFSLRGKIYVRDTIYDGTNAVRTTPAQAIAFNKATLIGDQATGFIVGVRDKSHGGDNQTHPLASFDGTSWRTLRNAVYDFAVNGSNVFTLESRSVWRSTSLTAAQGTWQRLDFTNVSAGARSIEVHGGVVYLGDTAGRLWAGRLDGTEVLTNNPSIVNEQTDEFGKGISFDGDLVAMGAPDYSGGAALSGQVTIWTNEAAAVGRSWRKLNVIDPPAPSFNGWFGKEVVLKGELLAILEGGRDVTRTNRGQSAQVHLYRRSGDEWSYRTNVNLAHAQSIALKDGSLAVGGKNTLQLFSVGVGGELLMQTNFTVAPTYFNDFQSLARVALQGDRCFCAVLADAGSNGGVGQIRIYQRNEAGQWSLKQTIRSEAAVRQDLIFRKDWKHDSTAGVWRLDGQDAALGQMISHLTSPTITVPLNLYPDVVPFVVGEGPVKISFRHRWSFEPGFDRGEVLLGVGNGPLLQVPRSNFVSGVYNSANAFMNQSPGHASSARIFSEFTLPDFASGNFAVQFRYTGDNNTIASIPAWEIDEVMVSHTIEYSNGVVETNSIGTYRFNGEDGGFTVQTDPPRPPDRFGFALAVNENWLAVGAPRDDQAAMQAGAVHLYERAEGDTFELRQTILSPVTQVEANFGTSVALSDSLLLVGCPGAEVEGKRHLGRVFAYHLVNGEWHAANEISAPLGAQGEFGMRVQVGSKWLGAAPRFSEVSNILDERITVQTNTGASGLITAAKRLEGGEVELRLIGTIGTVYRVQKCQDLAADNWKDLVEITMTTGETNVLDRAATEMRSFYRLKSGW